MQAGPGLARLELRIRANLPQKFLEKTLQQFTSTRNVVLYDKENRRLIHPDALEEMKSSVTDILADYHGRFPLKAGMPKEEIPALLSKPVDAKLYNFVLRQLAEAGQIAQEMEWVRLTTHKVALSKDEDTIRRKNRKDLPRSRPAASLFPGSRIQIARHTQTTPGSARMDADKGDPGKNERRNLLSRIRNGRTSRSPGRLAQRTRRDHHPAVQGDDRRKPQIHHPAYSSTSTRRKSRFAWVT